MTNEIKPNERLADARISLINDGFIPTITTVAECTNSNDVKSVMLETWEHKNNETFPRTIIVHFNNNGCVLRIFF